jgi:hypothetical protein
MYCRRVESSGKWLSESSSKLLCATKCVCKALCSIKKLVLCLDLVLGRRISCSMRKSTHLNPGFAPVPTMVLPLHLIQSTHLNHLVHSLVKTTHSLDYSMFEQSLQTQTSF